MRRAFGGCLLAAVGVLGGCDTGKREKAPPAPSAVNILGGGATAPAATAASSGGPAAGVPAGGGGSASAPASGTSAAPAPATSPGAGVGGTNPAPTSGGLGASAPAAGASAPSPGGGAGSAGTSMAPTSGAGAAASSGAGSATGSAATGTATSGGAGAGAGAGSPGASAAPTSGGSGAAAGGAVAAQGPQLFGTVPPDPTTGFDGSLYLVGERLVPGSVVFVEVNGVPTKVLPATFYSSELLGVYVYFTVPADYTFTAVAPDGTRSTPLTFTVPNGGLPAVLGLRPPEVQMVFPPQLDAGFRGTLWLIGDQFQPGSVATLTAQGMPPLALPLAVLNERTAGLALPALPAGPLSIQIANPTLLASQPFALVVGPAPATSSPTSPQVQAPTSVASPFLGAVHLLGTGIEPGAWAELRPLAGGPVRTTPLVWLSSHEAHWVLAYPRPGAYELRVVNPGGGASAWLPFDVR